MHSDGWKEGGGGGGQVEEEETQVVQVHVDFCLLSLLHPEAKTWNSDFFILWHV